jgi:hypothetical protein
VNVLEVLGVFVHGALAFGHALGVVFNVITGKWKYAAVHAAGMIFSVRCAIAHAKSADGG